MVVTGRLWSTPQKHAAALSFVLIDCPTAMGKKTGTSQASGIPHLMIFSKSGR
jgi:hypothetical protein